MCLISFICSDSYLNFIINSVQFKLYFGNVHTHSISGIIFTTGLWKVRWNIKYYEKKSYLCTCTNVLLHLSLVHSPKFGWRLNQKLDTVQAPSCSSIVQCKSSRIGWMINYSMSIPCIISLNVFRSSIIFRGAPILVVSWTPFGIFWWTFRVFNLLFA